MNEPIHKPTNQRPDDRANQLPSWIIQDPQYAKLSHSERHALVVISNRCQEIMPDGSRGGCLGGRALEAAMGVSRPTKVRYVHKFMQCGFVFELARGITLNRKNFASIYGIPARRDTPYQSDTGGSSNLRRAHQSDTPLGLRLTQSAHCSKTQQPNQVPTPSGVGVSRNRRVGRWPEITENDLADNEKLLELHAWYAAKSIVPDSEYGLRIFFEAAENALANATSNAPGMFVRRIRDHRQQQLYPVAEEICDRASQRLKQALEYGSGEPRSGPSDNDAVVDQQYVDDAQREGKLRQRQLDVGKARMLLRGLSAERLAELRDDFLSTFPEDKREKWGHVDPLRHRGFTLALANFYAKRVRIARVQP